MLSPPCAQVTAWLWRTLRCRQSSWENSSTAIYTEDNASWNSCLLRVNLCSCRDRAVSHVAAPFSQPKSITICSVAGISPFIFSALAALNQQFSRSRKDLTNCSWGLVKYTDYSMIITLLWSGLLKHSISFLLSWQIHEVEAAMMSGERKKLSHLRWTCCLASL